MNVSSRPALLFLAHRIPYPPDKGDKIRSYHLIAGLAKSYRIFLGAWVDDDEDWQYRAALEPLCEQVHLVSLSQARRFRRMAYGMLRGASITLACYEDRSMARWVQKICIENEVRRAFAFSGGVAPLLDVIDGEEAVRVIDFVDVDSSKWAQYASTRRWPASMVFAREARSLLMAERRLGARADASVFVSRLEAEFFASLAPELAHRTTFVENGVDADYFSPESRGENPHDAQDRVAVFTGAMDYWPNIEAVVRFCEETMPALRQADSRWRFCIVGSNPDLRVRALEGRYGTYVTGRVDDVRPWLGHATVAVAPMHVARGVQNKVLEAMSMARPVLVTPQALEGIDAQVGRDVVVANTPEDCVRELLAIGAGTHTVDGRAARDFIIHAHAWPRSVERLGELLEGKR